MKNLNLTEKEQIFLKAMQTTDYGNPIDGECTWWFAIETPFTANVNKGITSSLVSKGLITSEYCDDEQDYITNYTELGLQYVQTINSTSTAIEKPKHTKLSDEQYIAVAKEFLASVNTTKKAIAEKYNIHPTTISDMFNEKYCRKSCKSQISELKGGN